MAFSLTVWKWVVSVRRTDDPDDPATVDALAAQLRRQTDALAGAVATYEPTTNQQRRRTMAVDLTALRAEVERDAEVNSAAATLLGSLAAKIEELKGDPVGLQELVDTLRSQQDALAAAVAANTPAES